MSGPDFIPESDVRRLVRLLSRVCLLEPMLNVRKHALLDGLGRLIGCDAWVWMAVEIPDGITNMAPSLHQQSMGLGEDEFQSLLREQSFASGRDSLRLVLGKNLIGTCQPTSRQAVADGAAAAALATAKPSAEPKILSLSPPELPYSSGIAFYRRAGREDFSGRETKMAEIILHEVGWLHDLHWKSTPIRSAISLTERERTVMRGLLDGKARKEIAHELGISINTVAGYARDIYKKFGVRSQTGLIHQYLLLSPNNRKEL